MESLYFATHRDEEQLFSLLTEKSGILVITQGDVKTTEKIIIRNFAQEIFTLSIGSCYKVSNNKRQQPKIFIFLAGNKTMLLTLWPWNWTFKF